MRRIWGVFLAMLPGIAEAKVITLFCRPSNGAAWVGQIDIDFGSRTIVWEDQTFSITYLDDLYIVAADSGGGRIGASTFMIERDTGTFYRAGVGRFCSDGDCTELFNGHFSDNGTCRAQSF